MRMISLRASGAAIAASLLMLAASSAHAATDCGIALTNLTNPNALDCVFVSGNVFSNSDAHVIAQQDGVNSLDGPFTFDGNFNALPKIVSLMNGNQINFGKTLFGQTIIGVHFGNVAVDPTGNISAFWLLDLGAAGANFVSLDNTRGFSNAVLYTTTPPAVPEPATWLMMIAGFGAIGFGLRQARRTRVSVSYA